MIYLSLGYMRYMILWQDWEDETTLSAMIEAPAMAFPKLASLFA